MAPSREWADAIRADHWREGGFHDRVVSQAPCETCVVLSVLDDADRRNDYWKGLEESLPPSHALLIQGPNKDGSYSVGVVSKVTPAHQVLSVNGPLTEALHQAQVLLVGYVQSRNTRL